jgi:parallel beta-helix repeat protein
MKKKVFLLVAVVFIPFLKTVAQSVSFEDDEKSRGYYTRPYLRYEAEAGRCETNGTILTPTYDQTQLQSEASNQSATQLIAKDSYIQWTNEQPADGLTIRFSLPDSEDGNGTKGNIDLYVNNTFIRTITLDSYWAWQYFLKNMSNVYPDNTPASNKFPRMRFDELHVKLDTKIQAGATFKLVKADDNNEPYTIDFVELEEVPAPVTFESIEDENKIEYTPDKGNLNTFISSNGGKTIYLPAGKYNVERRIYITVDGTKIIGAGMWHTELYFTAPSDNRSTHNQRGIETQNSNIVIDGLFLNTVNNRRYYDNNSNYQVGKGLMGSFGSNSIIKNVWAEHFECGAWIEGCNNLTISDCRFRNNYADGINLSYGSKNSVVEHCSYRNNGDDDIATWSRNDRSCENNIFRHSTSENNWRASSLGFFGGKQNKAHHIVIIDPMEAGFRITSDFPGAPFSNDGYSEMHDISVYRGGVASGSAGSSGDLWGNQNGALHINSSSQYDLQNFKIYNIDFYDSKNDAVFIGSGSRYIRNLHLKNIGIHTTGRYGLYFNNARGSGSYCRIEYENIGAATNTNNVPASFSFFENCFDDESAILLPDIIPFKVVSSDGNLFVSGKENTMVSVYDISGRINYQTTIGMAYTTIPVLCSGVYIVTENNYNLSRKVFVR